jgi:DNA-binding CsgD family transcriptional regulator
MGAPASAERRQHIGLPKGTFWTDLARMFKPRFLCMGFLWAWIYCLWFTPAIFSRRTGVGVNADPSWLISLVAVTVTLLFTPLVIKATRQLSSYRWMLVAAPLITGLGTIFVALDALNVVVSSPLMVTGAVATGLGSGLLWIMIGEFYSRLDPDYVEVFAPASAFVIVAAIVPVSAMSGLVPAIGVSMLPIVSGILLVLAFRDEKVSEPVPVLPLAETPGFWSYFIRIGLGSMTTYTVIAFVWSQVSIAGLEPVGGGFQVPFLVASAFAGMVAVYSIYNSRRLDILTLYRWMPPFLVLALALLSTEAQWARVAAYVSATIAQIGFDIMIWIFFAGAAHKGIRTPAVTLGMGRGFVQVGVTLGSALGIASARWIRAGETEVSTICVALICALVVVTAFMQERRDPRTGRAEESPEVPVALLMGAGAVTCAVPEATAGDRVAEGAGTGAEAVSIDQVCAGLAAGHGLSPRETEVFCFLARGRSLPYIREQLVLSKNTIDTHAKNLYRKLDVHTRQELIDLLDRAVAGKRSRGDRGRSTTRGTGPRRASWNQVPAHPRCSTQRLP